MVNLGNRLKNLRIQNGLTQEYVAMKTNISKSSISSYEKGVRCPPYSALVKLAHFYQVTTDYLLGMEPSKNVVDLSGLTIEQKAATIQLVHTMQNSNSHSNTLE